MTPFSLKQNAIHIWSACLKLTAQQEAALDRLLSQDEIARANNYKIAKPKTAFIATRGILRMILSHYLQIPPTAIEFDYLLHKKPMLTNKHHTDITFNISHSHTYALFAIARQQHIGIDIEKISAHAYLDIAERFFNPEECAYLHATPLNQQAACFHQLWTRKEAVLKAIGIGLTIPLNQFSIVNKEEHIDIEKKWWFYKNLNHEDLRLPEDYRAAIASDKPLTDLVYWDFHETLKG